MIIEHGNAIEGEKMMPLVILLTLSFMLVCKFTWILLFSLLQNVKGIWAKWCSFLFSYFSVTHKYYCSSVNVFLSISTIVYINVMKVCVWEYIVHKCRFKSLKTNTQTPTETLIWFYQFFSSTTTLTWMVWGENLLCIKCLR